MNHATRIRNAAGATVLVLAGLTATGLATQRDHGPATATAPQPAQVSQSVSATAPQVGVLTLPQSIPADYEGGEDG